MSDELNNARDAMREYGWNWFAYHANQRLVVFRFYLIVAALVFSGAVTVLNKDNHLLAISLFLFLILITILFWRLDIRNSQLVKIAENALKVEEDRLFGILGSEEVRITQIAEKKPKYLSSFSQIYRALFMLIIGICMAFGWWSINEFYKSQEKPPPAEDFQQNSQ